MKMHLCISFILSWSIFNFISAIEPTIIKQFGMMEEESDAMNFIVSSNPTADDQHLENFPYTLRTNCPWPYLRIAGLCLNIGSLTQLSWEDARSYCNALDGDLASLDLKLGQVAAYVKGSMFIRFMLHGYWIGARRLDDDSSFQWLDGSSLPDPKSSIWIYQDNPGFDCVAFNRTQENDVKLVNYNCTDTKSVICQCHMC